MPDNEWTPPNAPDLQNDFNKEGQSINEARTEEPQREMVTLEEQKMLEAQRDALVLEQHYTIDGPIEQVVNTQVNEKLENRINYIRKRREAAQQKLREDFRDSSRGEER